MLNFGTWYNPVCKALTTGWIATLLLSLLLTPQAWAHQTATVRIDSNLASLARDQIRAGHYQRFLKQQQGSSLEFLPDAFVFDYPPAGTQGQIQQIFWNEPESLFAVITLGKQDRLLPGHLLHFYKTLPDQRREAGGALVVLQTFNHHSYVQILRAERVPAVNDRVE